MTDAQEIVLRELQVGGPRHSKTLAQRCGYKPAHAARVLDALFRRSLVTIDTLGRWAITERGARKVLA